MHQHFTSFTPEAMRAFGQELAADLQRRMEFIDKTRKDTFATLAQFRREHRDAEAQRCKRAAREADNRQQFVSELKSGVNTLLQGFDVSQRAVAADLREMAGELKAACETWRNRPGFRAGVACRFDSQGNPKSNPPSKDRPSPFKKRHG